MAVLVALSAAVTMAPASEVASPIEATYQAVGPWEVTTATLTASSGEHYDLFRPRHLGDGGFRHPIITWGNGSLTPSEHYSQVLRHLASWGFVVVASRSTWTGDGHEILEAARLLVHADGDRASDLYQKLDVANIGAMGHSQGAYGALNATLRSEGQIKTAVAINLPDTFWLNPLQAAELGRVTQDVFLVGGDSDWMSTPLGLLEYVEQLPAVAAVATLAGAEHDAIMHDADRYVGYITAWMMHQLQADPYAAGAFVGERPEILTNAAWRVVLPHVEPLPWGPGPAPSASSSISLLPSASTVASSPVPPAMRSSPGPPSSRSSP